MTNDQYIQVAEKVWGWVGEFWSEDAWETPDGNGWIGKINDEVNSWSGFGRTLESMLKKCYWFEPSFCTEHKCERISFVHETLASYPIHYKRDCLEELIEATHLAALEVVKQEEK